MSDSKDDEAKFNETVRRMLSTPPKPQKPNTKIVFALNSAVVVRAAKQRKEPYMAESGDLNRNAQRLLRKTEFRGTDHNQYIWALQCERDGCGHVYGANGSDFHQRRCPKCDGGAAGL